MENIEKIENMNINTTLKNSRTEKDFIAKKEKRLLFRSKCLMLVIDYACQFKKKYSKCDYYSLLARGIEAFEEELSNFYTQEKKEYDSFAENLRKHIKFVMEHHVAQETETKEQIFLDQNYVMNRLIYQLNETPYEANETPFENTEKEIIMLELKRLYMILVYNCANLFNKQNPDYYIDYFVARGIEALNNMDVSKISKDYFTHHAEFIRGYLSDCFSEQLEMRKGKKRTESENLEDELMVLTTFSEIDVKLAQYGMENPSVCDLHGYKTKNAIKVAIGFREWLKKKKSHIIKNNNKTR
jgi:hypothetical protein